jgi:hypothetical protein
MRTQKCVKLWNISCTSLTTNPSWKAEKTLVIVVDILHEDVPMMKEKRDLERM